MSKTEFVRFREKIAGHFGPKTIRLKSGKVVPVFDMESYLKAEGAMNAKNEVTPKKYEQAMDALSDYFFLEGRINYAEQQRLLAYDKQAV
jgi:hypothetical protein